MVNYKLNINFTEEKLETIYKPHQKLVLTKPADDGKVKQGIHATSAGEKGEYIEQENKKLK